MITEQNIPRHELIGLHARVESASNPQLVGVCGTITDETKNMLTIRTDSGLRSIPKDVCMWRLAAGDVSRIIEGKSIAKRPHERLEARRG